MRSAERIRRKPREWIDHQQQERERTLRELLRDLARARESGAEWYRWIADGQPVLSVEQYRAVSTRVSRSSRRGQAQASA